MILMIFRDSAFRHGFPARLRLAAALRERSGPADFPLADV
jgi:hypothetical protein